MKIRKLFSTIFVLFALSTFSIAQTHKSVQIGTQVWMTENLNVENFRNGDPIPQAKSAIEWIRAGKSQQPAWCYYDNDSSNGPKYGKLYNFYAVADPRGLCPSGWTVPAMYDWNVLQDFLGGGLEAGGKIKAVSDLWVKPNGGATNSSGFFGLPGGFRFHQDGSFMGLGENGDWWTSSPGHMGAISFIANHLDDNLDWGDTDGAEVSGSSVRCLKE